MHNSSLNGRVLYWYAALLLLRLRHVHITVFKRHIFRLDAFVLTKIPQTEIFSLPMKETYLKNLSPFFYDPADKNGSVAARAKVRAQWAAREVKNLISIE